MIDEKYISIEDEQAVMDIISIAKSLGVEDELTEGVLLKIKNQLRAKEERKKVNFARRQKIEELIERWQQND